METSFIYRAKVVKKKTERYLQAHNVTNVMQIPEAKENLRKTVQEKYGVDCVLQNEEIKEKIRKTNLERYGAENPLQNPEIKREKHNK